MSRLLINEPPLQVLPSLAKKIGLNEAIFLQQLHFLSLTCRLKDGRRWYSIKVNDWCHTFRFWGKRTIERIIANLRAQDLIITTDVYNQDPEDRTLWYAINYSALEELDFGATWLEKSALSAVRQNGGVHQDGENWTADEEQDEKAAPSAVRHFGGVHQDEEKQARPSENAVPAQSATLAEPPVRPVFSRGTQSAKLADSSSLRVVTTTPSKEAAEARQKLMVAGVGDAFKNWEDHLKLTDGPALTLTLGQWATWAEEGLAAELKEASTNVILMGSRANDPAAVLRGRMEKSRHQKAAETACAAERAVLNEGAERITEGSRYVTPGGKTLTVDYVEDGQVFWVEHAPEIPVGTVLRWQAQGGAS